MKVRQKYSDKTWKTQKKFQKIYFHFRGFFEFIVSTKFSLGHSNSILQC